MAFFRSLLKTLISQSSTSKSKTPLQNPNSPLSSSRTFFSLCSTSQPYNISHNPSNVIIRNPFLLRRHFLSPLSSALGPLFLSSPPWQLSQSATPLHFQCDVVLLKLPKVPDALNTIIPYRLGFQDINSNKNDNNSEEFSGSKLADNADSDALVNVTASYLNLPNFISFGRLLSGPLLGWYISSSSSSSFNSFLDW